MSAAHFARLAGVHYTTFANWRQKRRQRRRVAQEFVEDAERQQSEPGSKPLQLLEAFVESGAPSTQVPGLVVDLPGNARLRVESPSQLRLAAELLALLSQTTRL